MAWPNGEQLTLADVFTKKKRSEIMSRVKGKGNANTELVLVELFRKHHITGWRRQFAIPGKPDFAFPKHKLAIFVDGCFWHGCPEHATYPQTNAEFWAAKLAANKHRDEVVNQILRSKGWRVMRIWGHALRVKRQEATIRQIMEALAATAS